MKEPNAMNLGRHGWKTKASGDCGQRRCDLDHSGYLVAVPMDNGSVHLYAAGHIGGFDSKEKMALATMIATIDEAERMLLDLNSAIEEAKAKAGVLPPA